ncbi:MAG TPA: dTDP-4-dehydrorhamnose 3,5-epimerase [Longimicrobiales bacterium]
MKVTRTAIPDVILVEPDIYRDERGDFRETWHAARYAEHGIPTVFVQDNVATSRRGVLRGLHYQFADAQGKLVMTLWGEVFDVAVDLRSGSPTFGKWVGEILSAGNGRQLWIPEGFAHGYAVISERAVVSYKCTRVYRADVEAAVRFDDPEIGITWPAGERILSSKDAAAPLLRDIPSERLPGLG